MTNLRQVREREREREKERDGGIEREKSMRKTSKSEMVSERKTDKVI